MTSCKQLFAPISKIDSFATMDGGGIRMAIFFHGCPLKCVYCHNVEMILPIDKVNNSSLGVKVEMMSDKAIADKIIRNKSYYKSGGITFSGGEPLLHSEYILSVIDKIKDCNLNIAIDTSLCMAGDKISELLSVIDTAIVDIKFTNREDYIRYTGQDVFDTVINNIKILNQYNKKIIARTVIVDGINSSVEDIDRYAKIARELDIKHYELLPFHTLGFEKYEILGVVNSLVDKQAFSISKLKELQTILSSLINI